MSLRWPFGTRQGGMRSRLIFALDLSSVTEATTFVEQLVSQVGMFKVGK